MALYSGWFTGKVLHHVISDHLLPNSRMLQCPWSGCSEWLSTVDGSQVRFYTMSCQTISCLTVVCYSVLGQVVVNGSLQWMVDR